MPNKGILGKIILVLATARMLLSLAYTGAWYLGLRAKLWAWRKASKRRLKKRLDTLPPRLAEEILDSYEDYTRGLLPPIRQLLGKNTVHTHHRKASRNEDL